MEYNGTSDDNNYFGTSENDIAYGNDGSDYLRGAAGDDLLYGGNGDDYLRGSEGVDRIFGGDGFDQISFFDAVTQGVRVDLRRQLIRDDGFGNRERIDSIEGVISGTRFLDIFHGNDTVNVLGGSQGDRLFGYGGDDVLKTDGIVRTVIDGGEGRDHLELIASRPGPGADGTVDASEGVVLDLSRDLLVNDGYGGVGFIRGIEDFSIIVATSRPMLLDSRLTGSDLDNRLSAAGGNDKLKGLGGDDQLLGFGGNDQLDGGAGDDLLIGGVGKDLLIGGAGSDTFQFSGFAYLGYFVDENGELIEDYFVPADSGANQASADRILDFSAADGDVIDLSAIDAVAELTSMTMPDDAFTWLGTAKFTGSGGEVRYQVRGGNTYLHLDIGGEYGGDMVIRIDGEHTLTASDFIL